MARFEYKVFNMISDTAAHNKKRVVEKKIPETWVAVLNLQGNEGWEVVHSLTKNSFLLKRSFHDIKPVSALDQAINC